MSENAIVKFLAVSTTKALPSTRVHDLRLQQKLFGNQASLRVRQIAIDDEFYISQYSANLKSTFRCPDVLVTDFRACDTA